MWPLNASEFYPCSWLWPINPINVFQPKIIATRRLAGRIACRSNTAHLDPAGS
jgi:hypothetical protein